MLHDKWLSNLLSKDAYHINNLIDLKKSDLNIKNVFIDAKVNSSDIKSIIKLQELGFKCIEVGVQLVKEYPYRFFNENNNYIREARKEDESYVRKLSSISFNKSRFYKDPQIPIKIASKIKEEWAGNFFSGRRGDRLFIAQERDSILGFLLILKNLNGITIDLIAVDKIKRRSGLGKEMIFLASRECENPNDIIKVGTQIDNLNAINFYSSMGFKINSSNLIFHLHL